MQTLNNILQVNNVKKYFTLRRGFKEIFHLADSQYVKAVDDVSFTIEKGRVFVLAGESGSGKTTLARLILRAIEPDSGSIIFNGEDITKNTDNKLKKFRTNVSNDTSGSIHIAKSSYENNGHSHGAVEYS